MVGKKFAIEVKKKKWKTGWKKKYKVYGDDIAPKIASFLVKKYGFRYAIADEFYMDWSEPKKNHYWRKDTIKWMGPC